MKTCSICQSSYPTEQAECYLKCTEDDLIECVVCRRQSHGGQGWWAAHEGDEPVHTGACFREFNLRRAESGAVSQWEALLR